MAVLVDRVENSCGKFFRILRDLSTKISNTQRYKNQIRLWNFLFICLVLTDTIINGRILSQSTLFNNFLHRLEDTNGHFYNTSPCSQSGHSRCCGIYRISILLHEYEGVYVTYIFIFSITMIVNFFLFIRCSALIIYTSQLYDSKVFRLAALISIPQPMLLQSVPLTCLTIALRHLENMPMGLRCLQCRVNYISNNTVCSNLLAVYGFDFDLLAKVVLMLMIGYATSLRLLGFQLHYDEGDVNSNDQGNSAAKTVVLYIFESLGLTAITSVPVCIIGWTYHQSTSIDPTLSTGLYVLFIILPIIASLTIVATAAALAMREQKAYIAENNLDINKEDVAFACNTLTIFILEVLMLIMVIIGLYTFVPILLVFALFYQTVLYFTLLLKLV
ncbi:hypothetical protein TrispH2_001900 [Trichoplax sp. H2]|uniref:Uncharacterized protein n=1 Tax=Trichoplax adhaerens TaxID=10228 RepID=B3RYF6_TRIAD|nr:predicted protein [Trichoplax adhaerens]EDV25030.1 predicted protein [Trichoplax adhaerens]RDD45924.1 hypothetical protein TrispH2_001900 [Trichoplax sp. H2]|eukprot:XP_002112920.1 predicted protein [Trichoplax adhaerens]